MNCSNGCKTTTTNNNCCNNSGGYAFILVLFILIVLVGAAWLNQRLKQTNFKQLLLNPVGLVNIE